MKNLIKFVRTAGELPPHFTDMVTKVVPWLAVTVMVALVLQAIAP